MEGFDLARRLTAEALGTALLVAAVIGSGIMADRLSGGNDALALLCNTVATGAILVVIITIFAPVSGAHFNPAVSLVMMIRASGIGAMAFSTSWCRSWVGVSARSSPI
jgi:glycerol uptake facilitator-like aquaporin